MLQSNLGLRKEDGLMSSVMFNNWKNGVLVDKESKFKTLAVAVLGSELVLPVAGAYVFSHSFVSPYLAVSMIAGIYAAFGLATAFSASIPKALNLVHSNFSSIVLSIYMAMKIQGDFNSSLPYTVMCAPFFLDAVFSIVAIYSAFIMDFSKNLKQELLEGASTEERKFLPILLARVENYIYNKTDNQLMPELCNESFKNKAFEGRQLTVQLTSAILIFGQIYFSILSAIYSDLAPVFSVFVTIYALTSLYCFFGLMNTRSVLMSQSTFVGLKLTAIALGYLFESFRNGGFHLEISFIAMTAFLAIDAFLGYSMLVTRNEYTTESKDYAAMGSTTMSFISDNWKSNLVRSNQTHAKIQAFLILSFEMIFALSAFFTFSGVQQILAAAASIYAVASMVGYFRMNLQENIFTSYLASVVLAGVMMAGFVEISIAYVMLVTPFVIDAVMGLIKIRRAYNDQGFVKPTYTKEFVFCSSQVETI